MQRHVSPGVFAMIDKLQAAGVSVMEFANRPDDWDGDPASLIKLRGGSSADKIVADSADWTGVQEKNAAKRVNDLPTACDAYWAARTPRENEAAYHEMLLFGARDGFPSAPVWRVSAARWLRKLACRIDGLGMR